MLNQLLDKERSNINYFFDHVDHSGINNLILLLKECNGMIYFTGIGKSSLVADKIAQTLTSTGTRALFISPVNALHGDIGMINHGDIVIVLSKSGESEELMNLIPYMRNKGVNLVSVTNRPDSRLSKLCDMSILLPMQEELCPYNLCPTISSTIQMIFGDLLTVALMKEKGFTQEEYTLNHPSGRIGKRLSLRVRDLMITGENIPVTGPNFKLGSVICELSKKKCGCLLIVDEHFLLDGVFTDGDLRRALEKYGSQALEKTMKELMTHDPRSINPEMMASAAVTIMEADKNFPITILPVIDGSKKVVGLIKLHDLIQAGIS